MFTFLNFLPSSHYKFTTSYCRGMSADMKASLEELAALAGPPPPGSTLENVWKEYLGGLMQSLKQTDYIEHLEETIAVLKSKNAEFHNLVKDKKVAVTFLRYTDESQAYEVLGLKDSITDKELTDNLEVGSCLRKCVNGA